MADQRDVIKMSSSAKEMSTRDRLLELFERSPIPRAEILSHLGLFIRRQKLSKILFMNELYKQIVDVHGAVMEFGVLWGQNLALFESFRGIYEPYNHNRRIVGFDTFEGFKGVQAKDGRSAVIADGNYAVTQGYEAYLHEILAYHEQESPISHIKKFDLIKGDATVTFPEYLRNNPQTIIALAYFDFDIYQPTRECLEAVRGHLTKGSVIGFDELNDPDFPGETQALKEVLGLDTYRIRRNIYSSVQSYIVVE